MMRGRGEGISRRISRSTDRSNSVHVSLKVTMAASNNNGGDFPTHSRTGSPEIEPTDTCTGIGRYKMRCCLADLGIRTGTYRGILNRHKMGSPFFSVDDGRTKKLAHHASHSALQDDPTTALPPSRQAAAATQLPFNRGFVPCHNLYCNGSCR